jgi:hypothetical protein
MINEFQIKGLEKLLNSSLIKDIYPMIDHIKALYVEPKYYRDIIIFNIYLNDPSIDYDNMYRAGFDPHYMTDFHIKKYLPYMGIELDNIALDFIVRDPNGKIIYSYSNE